MYYNNYDFDENKKYLFYFRGNFGPPTKGHFSLVERYIHLPNVKYFIHQIGSENRHGVPYWLNRKIFKIYISELLPKEKITLKRMGASLDVLDYVEDIDVVIFLKGNEEMDREKEDFLYNRYSKLRKKLKQRRIRFDFLIIDRPEINTLSATKFVEALQEDRDCHSFVPQNLSSRAYRYIISRLKEEDLS